ncbi:MAG: hypothetical protein ACI9IL_000627 [Rickettsiales bacterium]|jgi:uncharacterized protein YhjY with autotransporter beta-barrel domain
MIFITNVRYTFIIILLFFAKSIFANTHNFSSDTTLTISSDQNYTSITTNTNDTGVVDFTANSNILTMENGLATDALRLKELSLSLDNNQSITINSNNEGIAFFNNINISQSPSSANNKKQISGSIILNSNNLNIFQKSEILNQAIIGNVIFNQDVESIFDNLLISGNVSGAGKLLSTNTGIITFNGQNLQTINTTQLGDQKNPSATLGDDDYEDRYINKLIINNSADTTVAANGVYFNQNVFVKDLEFNNDQENTKIFIGNSGVFEISGNVTHSNQNIENFYILDTFPSAEIKFTGISATEEDFQTVNAHIGQSTNRFEKVTITNSNIFFSKNLYLDNLQINQDPDILNSIVNMTVNSVLDVTNLSINNNLTLAGSGTTNIENIDIADNQILTLSKDVNISGNLDNLSSASTDKILSSNNKITFNGAATQAINTQLGQSDNRINKLEITNQNQISLTENSYIKDLSFTNSSGGLIDISTGKIIDISGNITAIDNTNSIIKGNGVLNINGTESQIISSKLGQDTVNRLANLVINNSNTTIDNNTTSYLTDLTLNTNSLSLGSGTILDINNSSEINLSNKTINYIISSNDNIKLISQNAGINTDNSNINIDYSQISSSLNFNVAQTTIDNSATAKTIDINQVTLTDNSYLLNPQIDTISANKELTLTHIEDSSIFSANILGKQSYEITNYLINDLGIYNAYSIENSESFQKFSESVIIPKNNSSFKSNVNLLQNINSITDNKIISNIAKKDNKSLWGAIFGNVTDHKTDKDQSGYDSASVGIIFGYNTDISGNNYLNSSIFYNNSDIDGKTGSQTDNIKSVGLSLSHKIHKKDKSGLFNYNKLNLLYNSYNLQRDIYLGNEYRVAKADTEGNTVNIVTGLGYNISSNNSVNIIPKIEYQYYQDSISSYQESGANNLSLKVEDQDYNSHKLKIGIDLYSATELVDKNSYFIYEPKLSLSFIKKIGGTKNQKTKISFLSQNQEFQIEMPNINDDYISINTSLNIYKKEKMPIFSIMYNGIFSKDIMSNSGSINLKYEF